MIKPILESADSYLVFAEGAAGFNSGLGGGHGGDTGDAVGDRRMRPGGAGSLAGRV